MTIIIIGGEVQQRLGAQLLAAAPRELTRAEIDGRWRIAAWGTRRRIRWNSTIGVAPDVYGSRPQSSCDGVPRARTSALAQCATGSHRGPPSD